MKRNQPSKYAPSRKQITAQVEINRDREIHPRFNAASTLSKNFKLNASTINPSTTFTEFIHPPLLGSLFSICGKMANSVKGIEKPSEKANIPAVGLIVAPEAASTSSAPTIGPTHERLTITVVNAKKKEPKNPPLSA